MKSDAEGTMSDTFLQKYSKVENERNHDVQKSGDQSWHVLFNDTGPNDMLNAVRKHKSQKE